MAGGVQLAVVVEVLDDKVEAAVGRLGPLSRAEASKWPVVPKRLQARVRLRRQVRGAPRPRQVVRVAAVAAAAGVVQQLRPSP